MNATQLALTFHRGGIVPLFLVAGGLYCVALNWVMGRIAKGKARRAEDPQYLAPMAALQVAAITALSLCMGMQIVVKNGVHLDTLALLVAIPLSTSLVARLLHRGDATIRAGRGLLTRNFAIVGYGAVAQQVRSHLMSHPHCGYRYRGLIQSGSVGAAGADTEVDTAGSMEDIPFLARSLFLDDVFVLGTPLASDLAMLLDAARAHCFRLSLIPGLTEMLQHHDEISYVGDIPMMLLYEPEGRAVAAFLKRCIDVCLTLICLCVALPLLVAVAIAVKIDSEGSIFYAGTRIGLKGRTFPCYKFRTMSQHAESGRAGIEHLNERKGILFKCSKDPRVTRFGKVLRKFSLDELPQLWNVLLGDMSLVGPRPPLGKEVSQYSVEHLRRLEVQPGITGLWQVEARSDPSFETYIKLDCRYVSDWGIWLDLKILMRTMMVVIHGTGS